MPWRENPLAQKFKRRNASNKEMSQNRIKERRENAKYDFPENIESP